MLLSYDWSIKLRAELISGTLRGVGLVMRSGLNHNFGNGIQIKPNYLLDPKSASNALHHHQYLVQWINFCANNRLCEQ